MRLRSELVVCNNHMLLNCSMLRKRQFKSRPEVGLFFNVIISRMIVFLYFLLEKYAEAIGNVERAIMLSDLLTFTCACGSINPSRAEPATPRHFDPSWVSSTPGSPVPASLSD